MYAKQASSPNTTAASNGVPTPTATPPPSSEQKKLSPAAVKAPVFKADIPEGESPKSLATEPENSPPKEEELPTPAVATKKQEEDKVEESGEREHDIYADAVLQCKLPHLVPKHMLITIIGSIDNKEECLMCSG
jgi:ribonucleoside-diphosphate reductase subunit M1